MKYFWLPCEKLEKKIDQYFERISSANREKYNGELSIILLGSLSRGEASWAMNGDEPYLISDIEFFTVVPDNFDRYAEFNQDLLDASKVCFSSETSSLFHIDNTYVQKSSLPNMERKVITFDAQNMGKVIVGDDVINLLPHITIHNVNQEDIWDIMIHRIFSVLYYGRPLKEKGNWQEYRYNLAKNSLDLMTVILAMNKLFVSGFYNKIDSIKKLDIEDRLKDYFDYCLSVKLGLSKGDKFTIPEMEVAFIQIIENLRKCFKVSCQNKILNMKHVIRRRLGMLKRGVQTATFAGTRKQLLVSLIENYKSGQPVSREILKRNYVLNGYPKL